MRLQQTAQHKVMACTTINAKVLLRRDTSENWTRINPILGQGEPAFELDTGKLKIGDGITRWNELSYIGTVNNNLIFSTPTDEPDARELVEYQENNTLYPVRYANITGTNKFKLVLASFTPTLSAEPIPGTSLNWDVPCTGFTVSVTNPDDFVSEYISGVANIQTSTPTTAFVGELSKFTTTGPIPFPAGGVGWTQTFQTNGSGAVIHPISSSADGDTVSTVVRFNVKKGTDTSLYTKENAVFTVNWKKPTLNLNVTSLATKTFLDTYDRTTYSIVVTNISNEATTCLHTVTADGGSVTNSKGNGQIVFSTPVHKDNILVPQKRLHLSSLFTRPSGVTGTSYSVTMPTISLIVPIVFTYPSFWILSSLTTPLTRSDIVSGKSFISPILGNQQNVFTQYVTNSTSTIRVFWFGIWSNAIQPNSFTAGSGPGFTPNFVPFTSTILLHPDVPPAGYQSNVVYNLYGINVQPNTTLYINISRID
jgi:hypothetical protein